MTRKRLILFFLVFNMNLPIFLSFAAVLASKETEETTFTLTPVNCPEEESKEDADPFEKEKKIIPVSYNISPFNSRLELNSCLFNDSKTITGNTEGPYTPPDLV